MTSATGTGAEYSLNAVYQNGNPIPDTILNPAMNPIY